MKPYYTDDYCTIYHGDCRDFVSGIICDVVITSPPYLQQRDYTTVEAFDWDAVVPHALSLCDHRAQLLVNLGLVHRDGFVVRYWDKMFQVMEAAHWRLFGWYVWDQGSGLPGDWSGRLAPSHEFVFHFNQLSVALEKSVKTISEGRKPCASGLRRKDGTMSGCSAGPDYVVGAWKIPDSVIRVTREMRRDIDHPARFPLTLPSLLISTFPGVVLDPFMGSGTTLRAAKDLQRKAIGVEIEEKYCEIAAKRLEQEVLSLTAVA